MNEEMILIRLEDNTILYGKYCTDTNTIMPDLYKNIEDWYEEPYIGRTNSIETVKGTMYINYKDGMVIDNVDISVDLRGMIYPMLEDDIMDLQYTKIPHWAIKIMNKYDFKYSERNYSRDLLVLRDGIGLDHNEISDYIVEMENLIYPPSIISKRGNNIYYLWSHWDLEIKGEGLVSIKELKKFIYKKMKKTNKIEDMDNPYIPSAFGWGALSVNSPYTIAT